MENIKLTVDQKILIYAALIAFFLSLFIGFIARNPLGIVLIRAFISAVFFGGLLYGSVYILKKYIPEMANMIEATEAVEKERVGVKPIGNVVDRFSGTQKKGTGEVSGSAAGHVSPEQASTEHVSTGQTSTGEITEGQISGEQRFAESMFEGKNSAEQQDMGTPSAGDEAGAPERGVGEGLPSLDGLFKEEEKEVVPDFENTVKESGTPISNSGDYITIGNAKIPNEPEIIAKAIQKVMKQDEYK